MIAVAATVARTARYRLILSLSRQTVHYLVSSSAPWPLEPICAATVSFDSLVHCAK